MIKIGTRIKTIDCYYTMNNNIEIGMFAIIIQQPNHFSKYYKARVINQNPVQIYEFLEEEFEPVSISCPKYLKKSSPRFMEKSQQK